MVTCKTINGRETFVEWRGLNEINKTFTMKHFGKRFIALVLALVLIFCFTISNSIEVLASEIPNFDFEAYSDYYTQEELVHLEELYDLSLTVDNSESESLKILFEQISPEAKAILLEYFAYDEVMLSTYQTYVDPDFQPQVVDIDVLINIQGYSTTATAAAADSNIILSNLSASLLALGLSQGTVTAFLAIAAEILTFTVITTAIIVAALVAYSVFEIFFGNWGTISAKWTQIKDAFASAFSSLVSSSTMSSAFSSANSTYQAEMETMARGMSEVRAATMASTSYKHISKVYVDTLIRNRPVAELYYSTSNRTMLFIFRAQSGDVADINTDFDPHSTYQNINLHIPTGAKIYVLYDVVKKQVFHVHLRLYKDDTEFMRYDNKMTWQYYPVQIYDSKYLAGGPTYLQGTIYTP